MNNLWRKREKLNTSEINQLAQNLGVSTFYAQLFGNRGITSPEQASAFLQPSLSDLHDPFLMKDMEAAVIRIDEAYNNQQKVWVYGDYDVDGTTSVALVLSYLRQYIANINLYIPDRDKEGYGLSDLAIEKAIEQEVDLIITLDCGIRSVEKVQRAKDAGTDFIICDHHEPGSEVPPAVAVLDAKQDDCSYPYKELSACGVGFKLIQALAKTWEEPDSAAYDYLDLVAVSIASDLVPITGENRILAYHGLKKLASNPTQGLKTIMEKFMPDRNIDITNIVFMIGPRINAAGRLASAKHAVKLLLADNDFDASELSVQLNNFNAERRELDQSITEEALNVIAMDDSFAQKKTTVVYKPHWHKGVVGIVASRLLESHYKPTIVLTKTGDQLVGSARSIEGFDIHDALTKCEEHLVQFGGHMYAAGMKLAEESLEDFRTAFEESASHLTEEQLTRKLYFDAELTVAALSESLYSNIQRLAPFGPENERPIFVIRNARDNGHARTMGKGASHLRLSVVDQSTSKPITAVAFGFGHLYAQIRNGTPFDLMFTIEENHFNGRTSLQLMVKDIMLLDTNR